MEGYGKGKEAKAKVQITGKYIKFDVWPRRGTRRCIAETGQGQMAVNAKMHARVLYKTATTIQHYDLCCCLNI